MHVYLFSARSLACQPWIIDSSGDFFLQNGASWADAQEGDETKNVIGGVPAAPPGDDDSKL